MAAKNNTDSNLLPIWAFLLFLTLHIHCHVMLVTSYRARVCTVVNGWWSHSIKFLAIHPEQITNCLTDRRLDNQHWLKYLNG